MNKTAQRHVAAIMDAETAYMNSTGTALLQYRQRKSQIYDAARAYKDEQAHIDKYLPDARDIARDALARAEYSYRNTIKTAVAGLKNELQAAISAPIPQTFTDRLSFYRAAALTPTKTDAESLIRMAGKNPLAIRAVAKLLDDTKAPIRIESRAVEMYEADLATLDELAQMPLVHAPDEVYTELCDVMAGQPAPNKTAAGYKNIGNTWTSIQLLTNGRFIAHNLKEIEAAADAWSADVTYQIREREHAEEVARAKEEAENAGEEYTPEREPVSSTSVEKRSTNGVELAAELGRQISENNANAAKTVQHYAK
ncbi:MAG: hypothetical protein IJK28_10585 [Clostridia bacterium]|nr:hypothetical protein [Clostridia bacterium]